MHDVMHYLRVALTPPSWDSPWFPGIETLLTMTAVAFWWTLALCVALLPFGLLAFTLYAIVALLREDD